MFHSLTKLGKRQSGRSKASVLDSMLNECSVVQAQGEDVPGNHRIVISTELQLMGRQSIARWKTRGGRSKDWRRCYCTKRDTKRQESGLERSVNVQRTRMFKTHHIMNDIHTTGRVINTALPANALKCWMKGNSNNWGKTTRNVDAPYLCRKKSQNVKRDLEKLRHRYFREVTPPINESNEQQQDDLVVSNKDFELFHQRLQNELAQISQTAQTQSDPSSKDGSPLLNIHHPGQVLLYPWRLSSHLRCETHYEVYALESLSDDTRYEVKVFDLRGLHKNARKRRVDDLKRTTASPLFIKEKSFNWPTENGRKYCVFECEGMGDRLGSVETLGAIGRNNTKEYREVFPELPKKTSDDDEGSESGWPLLRESVDWLEQGPLLLML